jgi:hypothetical protein
MEYILYTAVSIKVVPEQSGKVEYERERLLGIAKKLMNFLAIPSSLSRSYSTFPLCSGTTLLSFQLKCSSNIDSIHYLRLINSFHQVPRDIHTLPVKEPIPRI